MLHRFHDLLTPFRTGRPGRARRWARAAALALGVAIAAPGVLPAPGGASGGSTALAPVANAAAQDYADVDPGRYAWAIDAIRDLRARGLMVGVDATHFAPAKTLTRAEMAALFSRLKALPLEKIGPSYGDVAPSDWFYPYVKAASANGLLLGVAEGTFSPEAPVTRAMTSVVAVRSLGLDRVAKDLASAGLRFPDGASVPEWARGAVSIADSLGVMEGDARGFRPQDAVTRAEAAVIVERLLRVSDAQAARQGNRAVAYLNVEAGRSDVNVGESTTVKAWGHDGDTYLIPAEVAWTADHGTVTAGGRFTATSPGTATVTARIPGTSIAKSVHIAVHRSTGLVFGDGTPPLALVGRPFPVAVAVVEADGRANPADSGRAVTLALRAPDGATKTLNATASGGWATFSVQLDQAGQYQLTASAAGLPSVSAAIQAVAEPVGALEMTVAGEAGAGGPIGVQAASLSAISIAVRAPDGSLRTERFPVHVGVTEGAGLAALSATSALIRGSGPFGNVAAREPGEATLMASVPGGALTPATARLTIRSRGTLVVSSPTPNVQAGGNATVSVRLVGPDGRPSGEDGVSVTLVPWNPGDYAMPPQTAKTVDGVATFTVTPTFSGDWGMHATAAGYTPAEAEGVLHVAPGPAMHLEVHVAPSTLLAPGETANVVAELADAYGNAVPAPFTLAVAPAPGAAAGDPAAGALSALKGSLSGPGVAATFTAGKSGSRTLVFRSPDHPSFAPVSVTFRVLEKPEDVAAGKGLWLLFADWKANGDDEIVRRAVEGGYTHIYLEVATSGDDFYGGRALDRLLWKAHAAGVALIAWTYPDLRNPAYDTAWSRAVIAFRTREGERPDAFAPDIEEVLTPSVVAAYAKAVREALGPDGRLVAITYPPQSRPGYPFRELVPYTDVFAPMSYWHHFVREYTYADAYHYVADSVTELRRLAGADVPVSVIGQTYDMFAAGAVGIYSPTPLELRAAADASLATGAIGLSFYRWGTTTAAQWQAMDGIRYE